MSEPTLSLAVGVGDVAAGEVCEKHTILFPLSHTGGLFHPYKAICPFCRAERAEARVKVLEKALRVVVAQREQWNKDVEAII
jgi:hypothetical protein